MKLARITVTHCLPPTNHEAWLQRHAHEAETERLGLLFSFNLFGQPLLLAWFLEIAQACW